MTWVWSVEQRGTKAKQTSPTWPQNTFSRVSFGLIASKLLRTVGIWETIFMKLLHKSFYLVVLSSTHIQALNPFKCFCLPSKSPFMKIHVSLWVMCVQKDRFKKEAKEGKGNFGQHLYLPIILDRMKHKSKWNWFSSCEIFSKSKQNFPHNSHEFVDERNLEGIFC